SGATNSTYSFAALSGTNYYSLTLINSLGSASSSTGMVVGVPATFLATTNYDHFQITFRGYTNTESLPYFPVLVRLSTNIPGFTSSQLLSPATGADLRFVAENGRELPFQIDQWNPSGESEVWVQVPSLSSSNDFITACWGNLTDRMMPACN